ncbi:E3 ubiquitin-protein ligase RNF4 [Camellia lanceoleosa]|uniref:E3 ubiquitin-protein ligase RNF4 n=1 Tax=Camellia lanceoleosa TaxID=1840588 RepID=A0ACC0GVR6_9ERIC|nr:E3 ubiquitin-protein ligase RNF4 [Camellia lanceoleosa]
MVLDLDLNNLPSPVDNVPPIDLSLSLALPWDTGLSQIQTTTELESDDDEVVICSPRSFAEAKARRNRGVIEVIDAESDFQRGCSELRLFLESNNRCRRGPPKHTSVDNDCCVNLENNEKTKSKNVSEAPGVSQSVPPPKAPGFSCPVCMGPFVEETSTKCGHIFCKMCIYAAIAVQNKCPTCRRKIKVKDTFRIYLPSSD